MKFKKEQGFTVIELMVVISILVILATIILIFMGKSTSFSNDSKIKNQLSSMRSQAMLWKPIASLVTTTPVVETGTSSTIAPVTTNVNMFNDGNPGVNSLLALVAGLPKNTYYAYYEEVSTSAPGDLLPSNNAHWVFAASLSTGAFCADSIGNALEYTGTSATTPSDFTTDFPKFGSTYYSCK